jgi:hypothetical protein
MKVRLLTEQLQRVKDAIVRAIVPAAGHVRFAPAAAAPDEVDLEELIRQTAEDF